MRLGPDQLIGQCGIGRLQRQLDLLQAGLFQRDQPLFAETDAGSDQVAVQADFLGVRHQFLQILALHGLTTGEADLQRTQRPRFAHHAPPLVGGQFERSVILEIERVAAPRAFQRTAISQFQRQPQRLALAVQTHPGRFFGHREILFDA